MRCAQVNLKDSLGHLAYHYIVVSVAKQHVCFQLEEDVVANI